MNGRKIDITIIKNILPFITIFRLTLFCLRYRIHTVLRINFRNANETIDGNNTLTLAKNKFMAVNYLDKIGRIFLLFRLLPF